MSKVSITKNLTTTTIFSGESFSSSSGDTSSSILNVSRFDVITLYANANSGAAGFAASLSAEVSPDGTNFFAYSGFSTDESIFTNASLFTDENFTSTSGATLSTLNISRFDDIVFYADSNATGAVALVATITAEISADGSSFQAFPGFIRLNNDANTATTAFSLATNSSEVFSMKNLGAIHSIRFSLTMANQIASTTINLKYSGRVRQDGISSFTLNTDGSQIFEMEDLGGIHSVRFTLGMDNNLSATTSVNLRFSARTQDD